MSIHLHAGKAGNDAVAEYLRRIAKQVEKDGIYSATIESDPIVSVSKRKRARDAVFVEIQLELPRKGKWAKRLTG